MNRPNYPATDLTDRPTERRAVVGRLASRGLAQKLASFPPVRPAFLGLPARRSRPGTASLRHRKGGELLPPGPVHAAKAPKQGMIPCLLLFTKLPPASPPTPSQTCQQEPHWQSCTRDRTRAHHARPCRTRGRTGADTAGRRTVPAGTAPTPVRRLRRRRRTLRRRRRRRRWRWRCPRRWRGGARKGTCRRSILAASLASVCEARAFMRQ